MRKTSARRAPVFFALLGLLALCQLPTGVWAQDGGAGLPPVALQRIEGDIDVDGLVDEAAWDAIEPLPLVMYSPTFRGEMTEQTEIRVGYDDQYFYVSGRMRDSEPAGIRANTFNRDSFSGDDQLAVLLDSYNDFDTAVTFTVNPNGARSDRTVFNDAEFGGGGMPFNSDWNAHWDAAARLTEDGWSAEMRIPFSTLRFQDADGQVTMGLIVYRSISRKNERHLYPAISPEWGFFGFGKPSLAQRVTLDQVRRSTPIYVTPYALGGLTQVPVLQEPEDRDAFWGTDDDPTTEPGVDIKYSPSSNLALDLTVNTDFAQVEADDQQLNLTRFPLFFPEKRQFFQERSATFDFSMGGFTDRLFFSRQIGLDRGQLRRIYGGGRVVGRAGGLDFGLLNMQTAAEGDRSGENMGVLRLKQQILNPYSYIGGMITSRMGSNGEDNIAYGVDSELRLFGDQYLTAKWAQTFDEAIEEGNALDAGMIFARFERRRQEGVTFNAQYRRVGEDFLPRLGFQGRRDFTYYGGSLGYAWFPRGGSSIQTVSITTNTGHYYRNADQTAETRSFNPQMRVAFRSGAFLTLGASSSYESIDNPFRIVGLPIDVGEYWFHEAEASWRFARGGPIRGEVGGSAGSFYDGRRMSWRISPQFNMSKHLELRPSYQVNRFEFEQDDLTTHLASLTLNFALDTQLSLSTLAQYNSTIDRTSVNARLRYHFREGTDLWIVYNEGYNMERDNGDNLRLPFSAGRALMIKYSHTLTF